jgi:hypothetical protein
MREYGEPPSAADDAASRPMPAGWLPFQNRDDSKEPKPARKTVAMARFVRRRRQRISPSGKEFGERGGETVCGNTASLRARPMTQHHGESRADP